jgi:hypothetical protein
MAMVRRYQRNVGEIKDAAPDGAACVEKHDGGDARLSAQRRRNRGPSTGSG